MAIVTVTQMREHLNLPEGTDESVMWLNAIAAQDHIERILGYKIEEQFGGEDQPEIPASLIAAVQMLAAHWYEQRETVVIGQGAAVVPFGVSEIVTEYRDWSF